MSLKLIRDKKTRKLFDSLKGRGEIIFASHCQEIIKFDLIEIEILGNKKFFFEWSQHKVENGTYFFAFEVLFMENLIILKKLQVLRILRLRSLSTTSLHRFLG